MYICICICIRIRIRIRTLDDVGKMFTRDFGVGKIMLAPLRQNRCVGKIKILPAILPARHFRCGGATKSVNKSVKTSVGKKKLPQALRVGKILTTFQV